MPPQTLQISAFGGSLPWPKPPYHKPGSAPGNGHVTSVNYRSGEEKAVSNSLVIRKLESVVKDRKGDKKKAMQGDFTENSVIREAFGIADCCSQVQIAK